LDTLDYSERTLWSDGAGELTIAPRSRLIGEAGRIEGARDGAYDAVLGSHVLEHLANPLGALVEWRRVVRTGGHILLVVPHREGTFDHRRPVTPLEHLRKDRDRVMGEDDMTHLQEILELHDLARDPGARSREAFERRCRENAHTRAMHHHVFDSRAVVAVCREAGLEVVALRPKPIHDIFCLCRVGGPSENGLQSQGLSDAELSSVLRRSPFASDRAAA
jgi:SAM-dependent methyltransferase